MDVLQRQQLTRQNYIAAAGASVDSYMSSKDLSLIEDSAAAQQQQKQQNKAGAKAASGGPSTRVTASATGGFLRAMTASQ